MVDGGRVVAGVALVLVVGAGPAWVGAMRGARLAPVARPVAGGRCLEPGMARGHPALLAAWRDRVRAGDRLTHDSDGRAVRLSLSETCLGCHGAASTFCERCHAQIAVSLSCWQCHDPGAAKGTSALAMHRPDRADARDVRGGGKERP